MMTCAGGIDASISARGPASSQHTQLMAQAQALAQRGAVTARATVGTSAAAEQQRNESRASTAAAATADASDAESDSNAAWESGALTPAQALRRYSEYLTPFEQSEILEYPEVGSYPFFVSSLGGG